MRLIDADTLMRIYQEVLCPHVSCVDCSLLMNDWNCRFETMLREALTIDAVPITRCRECKYHEDTSVAEYEHCCLIGQTVRYDDFCSYGERKDGAE